MEPLPNFPIPEPAAWIDALRRELKDFPPEALTWKPEPGLAIPPLVRKEDVEALPHRALLHHPEPLPCVALQWIPSREMETSVPKDELGGIWVENERIELEVFGAMPPEATVNLTRWHDAGVTAVDELALLAAEVAQHLRGGALSVNVLMRVGAEVPMDVARLRAARALLVAVGHGFGRDLARVPVYVSGAMRDLTAYGTHTNLLRGTLAALSAHIGGAAGVAVLPFDLAAGGPSPKSLRMARNTVHLLHHESHVDAYAPVAEGAYAMEFLAHQLLERAYARFQEIEVAGGFDLYTSSEAFKPSLSAGWHRLEHEVSSGKRRITGVTRSPDATETLQSAPAHPDKRLTGALERLRFALQPFTQNAVVVAHLFGATSMANARLNFAAETLGVAGIRVTATPEKERVAAVVLCADDDSLTAEGMDQLASIRAKYGKLPILIAAPPAAHPALMEQNVHFVHAKAPLLDLLHASSALLFPERAV